MKPKFFNPNFFFGGGDLKDRMKRAAYAAAYGYAPAYNPYAPAYANRPAYYAAVGAPDDDNATAPAGNPNAAPAGYNPAGNPAQGYAPAGNPASGFNPNAAPAGYSPAPGPGYGAGMPMGPGYVGYPRYTPDFITWLQPNEIFVFGTNIMGRHDWGAALSAVQMFGAVYGQAEGLQGQSYAIPVPPGGIGAMKPYVDRFIEFAKAHPELIFLVTKIGCGDGGFKKQEVAPLFAAARMVPNIILPKKFYRYM